MRTKVNRLIAVVIVVAVLSSMMVPAFAADPDSGIAPHASYYISSVYAYAAGGTGSITVHFSIVPTGKMTSLGATKVQIYDYNDTLVKTFYSSSTSGMLISNAYSHSSSVTYYGATSGQKYYAVVTFKAANSSGGDSDYYVTAYAKAK